MVILYTVFKNSYIDIKELDELKGVTCYVNSTNRCSCACTFCLRNTKEMLESNSLWLKEEPTVEMIIEEFKKYDLNDFKEVVFCGFGEPLTRHDDLMKVAKYLKETRNDLLIRINTNGLSSVTLKRDITPDFKEITGTVSNIRLDSIIATAFQSSRNSIIKYIHEGKVFINGKLTTSNGAAVKEGDIISVRGKGRFIFECFIKETKKGRNLIKINLYQ